MQKQLNEMKDLVKGINKKLKHDSDNDWFLPRNELVVNDTVKITASMSKTKSKLNEFNNKTTKLNTKNEFNKTSKKIDKIISMNMHKHKASSLDGNQ